MIGIHSVMRQSYKVLVSRHIYRVIRIFNLFVPYSADSNLLFRVTGILLFDSVPKPELTDCSSLLRMTIAVALCATSAAPWAGAFAGYLNLSLRNLQQPAHLLPWSQSP